MRCAIWYRLYNLKDVKNSHGGLILLVKLQAQACNITKSNTPPWAFFIFLKIVQTVPNRATDHIWSLCHRFSKEQVFSIPLQGPRQDHFLIPLQQSLSTAFYEGGGGTGTQHGRSGA